MFGSILANLDEIEQERAVLEDQDSGAHVGTLVSGHLLILNIKVWDSCHVLLPLHSCTRSNHIRGGPLEVVLGRRWPAAALTAWNVYSSFI
jgi:hypothetical protein